MQPWPIKWSKPEKRKPLPDNNEEKGKKIRKFNAQWMNDRKWLKYDDHVNLMFCVPCTNFVNSKKNRTNYPNSFIKGCSNFKTSALSDHESSRLHKDAVQFEMALANPTKTIARQTLVNLNEHKRKQLEILFRNVHALVKNNRPLSDIEWLTELDRAKGVDCGETYANRKSATVFLEYIAMHESQKVSELVQKVKFFSMSMDGSTDEGCVEQETLFVRTCLQGKLQTKFLCIGEPKSTSSADLHALVLEQIEIYGLHSPELVGFGCDGAANMLGKKGGLVTLLKKDRPELHAVHCHAHKLELAFRDVVKPDLKYARLSTLLLGIYYFYKRSPKQRKCLKSTFQVMDIKGTLPHRVSGSRWMPHMHRALATLFKSFPAYITQLRNESHTNAKAEGLAKLLGNYQVMVYATLLRDILNPLVKLSLCLQSVDVTLADVHLMVEAILALLCSLKDHKSEALVQMEDCKELSGISLKVQGKPINSANVMENLIDKITQAIKSRFIDLTDVQFTEVSNFSNWPVALKDYGDDHIEVSSRRFAQTLTKQGIKTEDLKEQYKDNLASIDWMDVWNAFCSRGVEDILHLIDLLRTLPATSVPNETAFNQMKLIKTNRRQRLSNDHLNDCMVVKANSETVETFDPTPAIDNWMTCCKGPRKLYYSRKTKQEDKDKRQATEEIVIEDVEADSQETVKTPLLEEGSETMNEINEATTVDTEAERRGEEEDKESDFEEGYDSESDSELEQNEETNSLMMTNIICEIETE